MSTYMVRDDSMRHGIQYVVAPPGYYRNSYGGIVRDAPLTSGAEWGPRKCAMEFKTHRAAARVANNCFETARIVEVVA